MHSLCSQDSYLPTTGRIVAQFLEGEVGKEGRCEKACLEKLLWCFTCLVYVHSSCADRSSTCICNE